ncbi:MAG TPA: glycosyltransferase [Turneriella sp.]|nr:glycosyltransferase [Turneriella sp.]HNJ65928.1 glycosyltransferase [Turneriella sp.]HNL11748.1 glycosyltransferase [Turneriella sp.]HNL53011.1 glycosyltransferase [Turneriella sp.]
MGKIRVSVVTPTLNEERDLPQLLSSLKKQTFRDFEIIVADAGSKDRTRQLAEEYGARVVDGGMPGVGRNRGAAVANGEYLFFFDADVVLPDDFLFKAVQEMDEQYIDLATCAFYPISDLRLDKILFAFTNLTVRMSANSNPRAAGFCIFITKRLFDRIGGFDESLRLAEDHDLVERAAKFRPLQVLKSTSLQVSVRRLAKEGRFSLIQKYFQVEMHLMTKGKVRDDIIEYEFGNFQDESTETVKKAMDQFEDRLIKLEAQYNDWSQKVQTLPVVERMKETQQRLAQSAEAVSTSLRELFSAK